MQKSDDNPDSPYVVKTSLYGAPATLIGGSTIHSVMGFDFGDKHKSLPEAKREKKRVLLENTVIFIIDEISLMKPDTLYRLDLGLREIKGNNKEFGGCGIFLFGDLMQLRPVKGRYIFEEPVSEEYKLSFGDGEDSLWKSFQVILLTENHRQAEDKTFADFLNRLRIEKYEPTDENMLKERVRQEDEIENDTKTVRIFPTRDECKSHNTKVVKNIDGRFYLSKALHFKALIKNYTPIIQQDGSIGQTLFQNVLQFKIGCRVMLIHNIAVSDGLCNGAFGTIVHVQTNKEKEDLQTILVVFDNAETGKESRKFSSSEKHPNATYIRKVEHKYSTSKIAGRTDTATLIQFPLVVAFAVTSHKFQGCTIKQPSKAVMDLKNVFTGGQAYVMLSRVQNVQQLYLLTDIWKKKWYCDKKALKENKRLEEISINNNPSRWDSDGDLMRISFLNAHSIKNKFKNIKCDHNILKSACICLSETWLDHQSSLKNYELDGYISDFNINQRGKGLAVYYKKPFTDTHFHAASNFEISITVSPSLDIVQIYRSPNTKSNKKLLTTLEKLLDSNKPTIIGGDFNICLRSHPNNEVTEYLIKCKDYKKNTTIATHIDGNVLDHIYHNTGSIEITLQSKYYSDHDAMNIVYDYRQNNGCTDDSTRKTKPLRSEENMNRTESDHDQKIDDDEISRVIK